MFRMNDHARETFIWISRNKSENLHVDKMIQERMEFGTLDKLHILDEKGNDVTKEYIASYSGVKTLHEIYTK